MKKICLVQEGKFLLGIDAEEILARTAWAEAQPQRSSSVKAVYLGALLSRQADKTPTAEAVCLELRDLLLIVDQIAADGVDLINPPGPLPPACPRLAARLCPQVTIWGDTPVLLLNPAQILPVAEELGDGIGMVTMPEPEKEAAVESESAETAPWVCPADTITDEEPEAQCFAETAEPDDSAETASISCPPNQEKVEPQPEPPSSSEQQKKDAAAIDEETFQKVMAWTVACFKRRKPGEELRLGVEQLPTELAAMVWHKGLNRNIIQYLIDQIVLRCQESAGRRTTGGKNAD
ncbi:hypothetical protein [Candidatus Electronema sp. TJ]|uniref:hypothetical protein n=1 Tax=Candidatus Electronema sp. TJ TaxID=3401573 RepID=UPI003AA9BB7D